MGVLPLTFKDGQSAESLGLDGSETIDITGVEGQEGGVTPRQDVTATITRADGSTEQITLLLRIDTEDEVDYVKNGGILHYVLRNMAA
jgi:aconitate hydratase